MDTDNVEGVLPAAKPFDLIEAVTQMLKDAHVVAYDQWHIGMPAETFTTNDRNVARFHVNRRWRQILTTLPLEDVHKTREARGCLMDGDCDLETWLRKFKAVVIPISIKLGVLTVAQ